MKEEIIIGYLDKLSENPRNLKNFIEVFSKYFNEVSWSSGYGQNDAPWLAFYDYFREVVGLKEETEELTGLMELSKNCGWFIPHKHICWASEKYCELKRDEKNRLHCVDGAAVTYPDGWKVYSIHGIRVKDFIIENPELITLEMIDKESNIELRRIMIDQYEIAHEKGSYIIDSGAELLDVDVDPSGRPIELYRKEMEEDEPIVMVKLINSTLESDETRKFYFVRVPPHTQKAAEAVAWTFGEESGTYKPMIET